MATTKGNLAQHKSAVHEGVKYPCRQCDYMATRKSSLARHRRAVQERVKYPAFNVTIWQLQRVILQNTKEQFMKG